MCIVALHSRKRKFIQFFIYLCEEIFFVLPTITERNEEEKESFTRVIKKQEELKLSKWFIEEYVGYEEKKLFLSFQFSLPFIHTFKDFNLQTCHWVISEDLCNALNVTHFTNILDARSCVTCDKVLAELEKIDDDTDSFGVDFVKINDKRLAKQYGIKNFPALTYFR